MLAVGCSGSGVCLKQQNVLGQPFKKVSLLPRAGWLRSSYQAGSSFLVQTFMLRHGQLSL